MPLRPSQSSAFVPVPSHAATFQLSLLLTSCRSPLTRHPPPFPALGTEVPLRQGLGKGSGGRLPYGTDGFFLWRGCGAVLSLAHALVINMLHPSSYLLSWCTWHDTSFRGTPPSPGCVIKESLGFPRHHPHIGACAGLGCILRLTHTCGAQSPGGSALFSVYPLDLGSAQGFCAIALPGRADVSATFRLGLSQC